MSIPQDSERLLSQSAAEGEEPRDRGAGTLDTGEPERPSDAGQGTNADSPDAIVTDPTTGERFLLDWKTDGDENVCQDCGKRRPHTIRRINLPAQPVLCDEDHETRVNAKGYRR